MQHNRSLLKDLRQGLLIVKELQGEGHTFSRSIAKVTGTNVQMLADELEAMWLQGRRQHHRELGVASLKSWVLNKS